MASLKLPIPYKSFRSKLERISKKGQGQIVEWVGIPIFRAIFYTYLIKKYKSNCFVDYYYDIIIDIHKDDIKFNASTKSDFLKMSLKIKNCIEKDNTSNIILIPLKLIFYNKDGTGTGHANLLIFRKDTLIIEHFEPHGDSLKEVKQILSNFVNILNNNLQLKKKVELIQADEVCPYGFGFQLLEAASALPLHKNAPGFCLMWSFFFAELVLKNPTLTSKEITKLILHDLYGNDFKKTKIDYSWVDYFRNLISGYTLLLDEKIMKYFSNYYDEPATISKIAKLFSRDNEKTGKEILKKTMFEFDFKQYIMNEMNNKPHDEKKINFFQNISSVSKTKSSEKKLKKIKCPNGTKKNKITGNCEPKETKHK
jgi:hypothetical protein